MANQHAYIGIENLALAPAQKQTLVDQLKALGNLKERQPAYINHWRTRLDNEAIIFEAMFDSETVTIQAIKNRLGAIFGIDPAQITHTVINQSFSGGTTAIVTFAYQSTDYLRMALFGGLGAAWQESGSECRGYLHLYSSEWEG